MKKKLSSTWPCNSYLSSWKTFRLMSNENEVTADHLVKCVYWPQKENITICDLGCGDGHLIENLILKNPTKIAKIHLVDPDLNLINEARARVCETGLAPDPVCFISNAEECLSKCVADADVILLIHVVYLMKDGTLNKILSAIPFNVPLYVILDSPDSVFTALWKITAPTYQERAFKAHEILRNLPEKKFIIKRSTIKSQIKNPLLLQRAELRQAILSILTYSDFDEHIYPTVRPILKNHIVDNNLVCKSICYEVIRIDKR